MFFSSLPTSLKGECMKRLLFSIVVAIGFVGFAGVFSGEVYAGDNVLRVFDLTPYIGQFRTNPETGERVGVIAVPVGIAAGKLARAIMDELYLVRPGHFSIAYSAMSDDNLQFIAVLSDMADMSMIERTLKLPLTLPNAIGLERVGDVMIYQFSPDSIGVAVVGTSDTDAMNRALGLGESFLNVYSLDVVGGDIKGIGKGKTLLRVVLKK